MNLELPKKRKISDNQKVISKFVENKNSFDKYFFGREAKVAKQLIQKYGLHFLLWVNIPNGQKLPSLCWFLTNDGKNHLASCFYEYKLENPSPIEKTEQIELLSEKIGKDTIIKKEPKTLKEFLNLYGKN